MRGLTRGPALRAALMAGCALGLAGCVPFGGDPFGDSPETTFSPPEEVRDAAEQSRDLLSYTIALPAGWYDLTDDYLDAIPTSVLSGYWTMADDLSTDGPYVTMSLFPLAQDADVENLTENAAKQWESKLGDAERGDSGYAETAAGGVITWASVTGDFNGEIRTEHVAHILYGPYYMYVEVDTPGGDEANAHAILDALQTVTISGPVDLGDRAGAPLEIDGKWTSYCGSVQAQAQSDWRYSFTLYYDSTLWRCPEGKDYLGEWAVDVDETTFGVEVDRILDTTLEDHLDMLGIAGAVGSTGETPNGYAIEVLDRTAFAAPGGAEGVRIDTATTAPGGSSPSNARAYMFEDSAGGVISVFVFNDENSTNPDTAWLEPFIATLTTPTAS